MKTSVGIRLMVSGISTMNVYWVNKIETGIIVGLKTDFSFFNPLIS